MPSVDPRAAKWGQVNIGAEEKRLGVGDGMVFKGLANREFPLRQVEKTRAE